MVRNITTSIILAAISLNAAFAQKTLPILKSTGELVSIREGMSFYKDGWRLTTQVKPDVFVTNPFTGEQRVAFYSAIDSITFRVKPNKRYNFIIINGKDTAYTQINTSTKEKPTLQPKLYYTKNNTNINDTIPFYIGSDHGVHFKGSINGSDTVDFMFDTNAGAVVIATYAVDTKVKLKVDGSQQNDGADGTATVKTSSRNKIDIAGLTWSNVPLLLIEYKKLPFDAVLGWVAFDNKIIEIDYDHKIFIVHNSLPQSLAEYTKLPITMVDGIPYIKCSTTASNNGGEGLFGFDSGCDGTLLMSNQFATETKLYDVVKTVGFATSTGSAGIPYKQKVVTLSKLQLGDYQLYQVPLLINEKDPEGIEPRNIIGNNILKRFNTIIDFQNNNIYLKPNSLFYSPM